MHESTQKKINQTVVDIIGYHCFPMNVFNSILARCSTAILPCQLACLVWRTWHSVDWMSTQEIIWRGALQKWNHGSQKIVYAYWQSNISRLAKFDWWGNLVTWVNQLFFTAFHWPAKPVVVHSIDASSWPFPYRCNDTSGTDPCVHHMAAYPKIEGPEI